MAQIKEEDRKELKNLIEDLSSITNALHSLRKQVMSRLIMTYCYETIWGCLICLSLYFQFIEVYPICFIVVNILLFIILWLYFYLLIQVLHARYEENYKMGLNKLMTLVNYVDWEVFRKRQLYNDNDQRVENSISAFLLLSRTMVTPTNPKNKLFKFLIIVSIIFRYILLLFSLYLVYMNIWQA